MRLRPSWPAGRDRHAGGPDHGQHGGAGGQPVAHRRLGGGEARLGDLDELVHRPELGAGDVPHRRAQAVADEEGRRDDRRSEQAADDHQGALAAAARHVAHGQPSQRRGADRVVHGDGPPAPRPRRAGRGSRPGSRLGGHRVGRAVGDDPAVAHGDQARRAGADALVVGHDDQALARAPRRAAPSRRPRSRCRGCRWARRPTRGPARPPARGRWPRAAARRRTARPAGAGRGGRGPRARASPGHAPGPDPGARPGAGVAAPRSPRRRRPGSG